MDASSVKLHQSLLRFARGAVKAYGEWVDEQASLLALESLKQRKQALRDERSEFDTTRQQA